MPVRVWRNRWGRLSSWAVNRVVAPLARANSEHAERLMKALSDAPLNTRAPSFIAEVRKPQKGKRLRTTHQGCDSLFINQRRLTWPEEVGWLLAPENAACVAHQRWAIVMIRATN